MKIFACFHLRQFTYWTRHIFKIVLFYLDCAQMMEIRGSEDIV